MVEHAADSNVHNVISNVPIPDPSVMTTQQIDRARSELRVEIVRSIDNVHSIFTTRLDAMDKAAIVLAENVNRVPTLLDREIARIRELIDQKFEGIDTEFLDRSHLFNEQFSSINVKIRAFEAPIDEKFNGIVTQFRERDVRTDQDKLAATTAVNAALQAQKEAAAAQNIANAAAISKSEAGFTKEIDGLKLLINATKDAIGAQFSDLIGRVNRSEASLVGSKQSKDDNRLTIGTVVGIVGGVVGVLALFAAVVFGVMGSLNRNASNVRAAVQENVPYSYAYPPSPYAYPSAAPLAQPYILPVVPAK